MRVIVIGAGIIGLATAWRLVGDGHDVTVCDPAPAQGATHAAGGMLTPVAEAYHGEDDLTALLLASADRYPGFVNDLAAHLPPDVATGYVTSGTLIVGADAADRGYLAALHELAVRLGLHSEQITTREARRIEPLLGRVTCAYLAPDDHQVDPRTLAAALLTGLRARGVEIVEEPCEEVVPGEPPSVRTPTTTLEADVVVAAPGLGPLPDGLGIDLGAILRPVYGEVLRLRAPDQLASMLTHTVRGPVAGRPVYIIPRGDGRVLLGATSREDDAAHVSAGGVHDLLADAIQLMPAIREFGIDDVVARARPGTPDNAPLLGETAPGVIVAAGFFRHGILLSAVAADIVAALVRSRADTPHDGDDDLLDLARTIDPHRFSTDRKDKP
ncbi:MAG: glycine oxidase ThiO [Mobilicoccus sp.]|nr:glycine oxidase ThiO [Mobilicoccus sp.]